MKEDKEMLEPILAKISDDNIESAIQFTLDLLDEHSIDQIMKLDEVCLLTHLDEVCLFLKRMNGRYKIQNMTKIRHK